MLYTIEEQYEFHGGARVHSAPMKEGRVVLVRVHSERNPDAPLIYIRRQAGKWEYIGKFEVVFVTTHPAVCAWRGRVTGDQINEVLFLERR